MEDKEYSSSDSDDEEYVPNEEASEGSVCGSSDAEDEVQENDTDDQKLSKKKGNQKRKSRGAGEKIRKKTTRLSSADDKESSNDDEKTDSKSEMTEEEERARSDALWQSFLSETGSSSKTKATKTETTQSVDKPQTSNELPTDKSSKEIRSTEITPKVTTKNSILDEIKANRVTKPLTSAIGNNSKSISSPLIPSKGPVLKRGLSSVLGNLNKKTKINTLEQSKLQWDKFKEENDLKEELTTYNRGKNGYLEKQDFLQRIDSRQFEMEKEMRAAKRKTR
ncbi:hypothetical protein TKK_0000018 [Trichogramma kaykai]|uniref:Craniofacial development protein 1 n=1 Tax=Trichogramma kaykai TaxID=54128 RepID=A0ABD2VUE6_9HYME